MQITINNPNRIFLNSFRPLCYTDFGKFAMQKYNLPPFIDASCRREPDLENPFPSISALCRAGVFAPRLKPNDVIVYKTIGPKGKSYKTGHHLVAILQVENIFPTHQDGEKAYRAAGLQIPRNCIVPGNDPVDFDKTAGDFRTKTLNALALYINTPPNFQSKQDAYIIQIWDGGYKIRAGKFPCFIKTRLLYVDYNSPAPIPVVGFRQIFGGKIPPTRIPKKLTEKELIDLGNLVGIDIKII